MIALFNNCAEKGNVLVDGAYHSLIERLIARSTITRSYGGDRKSEIFKNQYPHVSAILYQRTQKFKHLKK
jgi:hypothetical protein